MEPLTQRHLLIIHNCVQDIYSPCTLETFPVRILSILSKVIPSEIPFYTRIDFQSSRISTICPSLDPVHVRYIEQTAHQHFHEHPCISNYLQTKNGQAYKISDFISESQLHHLQGLYEQFMEPLGMEDQIGIVLPSVASKTEKKLYQSQEELIAISLNRNQRNFSERDRFILNLLRPHFAQAYQNVKTLAQVQNDLAQLRHTLDMSGVVILTGDGKVKLITHQAEQWLKQYFHQSPTSIAYGLPENLQRWVKYQLALLTQGEEALAPRLPLRLEDGSKRLIVRLVMDRPGEQCLLIFEEQQLLTFSAATLELLNLTRREAEVLFWIAQGKNNMETAQLLSISSKTVKKYLENIYQKLGVQTRSAAVMRALERLGMLN